MSENKEKKGFFFATTEITFLNVWIWSVIIGAGLTCGSMAVMLIATILSKIISILIN